MITGQSVKEFLSTFNPSGELNSEEGFLYGSGTDEVQGICVCWMASRAAIEYAAQHQCNLIVCHEALTFYDYPLWAANPPGPPWPVDQVRLDLLDAYGIAVLRVHSTVDPTHVGPTLWEIIGLPEPEFRGWAYSQHNITPITVGTLAIRVREALGMAHLRVTGDTEQVVSNVGTAWGGGGLDRHIDIWVEHLLPRGIQALITGETSDFAQRYALDNGVALIETCHSASEDPGLARLAGDLAKRFSTVPVLFRPQEIPWTTL